MKNFAGKDFNRMFNDGYCGKSKMKSNKRNWMDDDKKFSKKNKQRRYKETEW